jgi:hypothetical protein
LTNRLLKKRQEGELYKEESEADSSLESDSRESEIDFKQNIGENLTSENTNESSVEPLCGSVKSLTLDGNAGSEDMNKAKKKPKKPKMFGYKKTKTQAS